MPEERSELLATHLYRVFGGNPACGLDGVLDAEACGGLSALIKLIIAGADGMGNRTLKELPSVVVDRLVDIINSALRFCVEEAQRHNGAHFQGITVP